MGKNDKIKKRFNKRFHILCYISLSQFTIKVNVSSLWSVLKSAAVLITWLSHRLFKIFGIKNSSMQKQDCWYNRFIEVITWTSVSSLSVTLFSHSFLIALNSINSLIVSLEMTSSNFLTVIFFIAVLLTYMI